MRFGGVAILLQPAVDMGVVGVVEAEAAVKEQGKGRVGGRLSAAGDRLSTGRSPCSSEQQQKKPPSVDPPRFHVLNVSEKGGITVSPRSFL